MRIRHLVPAASLVAMLVPAIATAQWKVTPFGGVYTPTTDIAKETATVDGTPVTAAIKHDAAFVLGLNANKWLTDRAGFEFSGGYAFSGQKVTGIVGATSGSLSENSYLILANAKLLLRLTPTTSTSELYAGVGPALVYGGNTTYSDLETKFERGTDVGGVVSLGYRYNIMPAMALKLGGDAYMYSAKVKVRDLVDPTADFTTDSKFQTDFVFHAGLSFTLPGMSK